MHHNIPESVKHCAVTEVTRITESYSSDFRIEEYVLLMQTPAEITMYLCKIIII